MGFGSNPTGLFINSRVAANKDLAYVCDVTGTSRLVITNFSTQIYSNWAVADFNLDGGNEACIHIWNSTDSLNHIVCYNSGYSAILDKVLPKHSSAIGLAIADFNASNGYMEAVTPEGIFQYDGASWVSLFNVSSYPISFDGRVQVVERDFSRSNMVIYSESTKMLVYGFDSSEAVTCGDGICSGAENPITCAVDCLGNATIGFVPGIATGEFCVNSSQCSSGKCLYGFCTLKDQGESCSAASQCLSAICSGGVCKKASLWKMLDAAKDVQLGDDSETNNLVSLLTLAFIGGGLIATGNPIGVAVGLFFVFAGGIFFVSVGWLSFWIFALGLIGALIGATFMVIFVMGGKN